MNAYVCVYRQRQPLRRDWERTQRSTALDPLLAEFLRTYRTSYYDWGDDPAFYSAGKRLGDSQRASWGVCRRDVRAVLTPSDIVVFFCAAQTDSAWHYYFIGYGTVAAAITRQQIWTDDRFASYRSFYNVLARVQDGQFVRNETFHPFHPNWRERLKAPYILFDPSLSRFNLSSPLHVADWDGHVVPERWRKDSRCRELEQLLFRERSIQRRLRTSATGYGHAKLNLVREHRRLRPGRTLPELRDALAELVH